MMQNMKFKKITAWIAMIAVLFVMSFSILYISKCADHNCTGEDCPVCAVVDQCAENIKNIGTAAVAIATVAFLYSSISKCVQYVNTVCVSYSLISQKVRLND